MLRRVPAADRQIETTREGEASVDDDDLLVLGGAWGHLVVQAEGDARRRLPLQSSERKRLTLGGIQERVIPKQKSHLEFRPPSHERAKKRAELCRKGIVGFTTFAYEPGATVDVPSHDQNGVVGLKGSLSHGAEERGRVDEHREPPSALNAPDVTAWTKNCHGHLLLIGDRCDNAQAREKCLFETVPVRWRSPVWVARDSAKEAPARLGTPGRG